jgi:type I restriction-modification system DNA methylase subunit
MPGKSFDENLTSSDLQDLGSADALTAFFARLGYNTNARLVQAPAALGIGQQDLVKAIEHSERLSEDGGLRVYLFKFNSVTKLLTDQLAKFFKSRSGEFLLVLVDDYKELDFVLLRREPSEKDPAKLIQTQSKLTLDRRRPSPVALRVLRRITFTEADPYAQFDKLKAAFDVAEWSEPHFNNRRLFTDHYLSHRLPEDEAWKEDPKAAFKRLAQTYSAEGSTKLVGMSATDLQATLFKPVFEGLGFSSFAVAGAGEALAMGVGGKPLVLALCYRWNRPLDAKDPGGDREDENPASKVVSVLEASDCAWAMVTNGKIWRLYSKHAHSRATNYYEVDLDEILTLDPAQDFDRADAFRYFWLLFRAKSLESGFLDRVLKDSQDYAKTLGDKLKKRVFEDVFPSLAEGFIQNMRAKDVALNDEHLEEVKQGTLLLLYRLLFVLYAEALDLLPLRAEERGYGALSLRRLCREIADKAGMNLEQSKDRIKKSFEEDSFKGYKRLKDLFQVINEGDATVNVPMYNGGLFADPADDDEMPETKAARFLKKWRVNDRHLAEALDLLARAEDEKSDDLVNVDYKSLGVRQLGSIYEGLLEYVVCIADKKLVAVREKNAVEYLPFSEMDEKQQAKALKKGRVVSKGHVYLANNKAERKATGSYYTPDYVVEYIVENTVGPVLKQKFEALVPRFREAQAWNLLHVKQAVDKGELKSKYSSGPAVEAQWRELVESFFDIKVLDPAMGSGHFLVEAVDFITDKAIAFLDRFPWNPVQAHLAYTREQILTEMETSGINLDRRKLDDINLLKRHVLKRCIYGVDLNPMAVELAKVSLWLDCFTLGAPLSFLDHHLRCGNSLVGTSVAAVNEIREAAGQLTLGASSEWQGMLQAIRGMIEVSGLADVTASQAIHSKSVFRSALLDLQSFKKVLDIHASRYFLEIKNRKGVRVSKMEESKVFNDLLRSHDLFDWAVGKKKTTFEDAYYKNILADIGSISKEKNFFHWNLEFPEVFYGKNRDFEGEIVRTDSKGFDAIVGNPPWGAELGDADIEYMKNSYRGSVKGSIDTFSVFVELAVRNAGEGSRVGLVLPDIFLLKNYPAIRSLVLTETAVEQLIHWGMPFEEVSLDVCTLVAKKGSPQEGATVYCVPEVVDNDWKDSESNQILQKVFFENEGFKFNLRLSEKLFDLLDAARQLGPPLAEICKIREGVHSGNVRDKLFLDSKDGTKCERLYFGRDEIKPFSMTWKGKWIQLDESRFNKNDGEYFNLGDVSLHRSKKILVRRTGDLILAGYDGEGYFSSNNYFLVLPNDNSSSRVIIFLLFVLNSKFSTWFFRSIQPRKGKLFAEVKIVHLGQIPIPFFGKPEHREWVDEITSQVKALLISGATPDAYAKLEDEFLMRIKRKDEALGQAIQEGL